MDIKSIFEKYKENKIALYGLGMETEKVLVQVGENFNIVGLLDGFQTDGVIYNKPIISMEFAIKQGVELVIVIARPGSCKAIAKRIAASCQENNISLIDIRGKDLLQPERIVYNFRELAGYKKSEIISQIKDVEVVSFDLFDTLIMRNTLNSIDVFDIIEVMLKEKGIFIEDFSNKRLAAEKKLSISEAPTLTMIYNEVLRNGSEISINASQLAEIEFQTDLKLIVQRRDVKVLMDEAKRLGKAIYITTDTYYSREQILQILDICNISSYDAVLISCEHNTEKTQELFEELIKVVGTKSILHIGDTIVSDIQSARKHGLQAIQIYNGQELLDSLGGLGLAGYTETIADRIRVGMFVANVFNSPFQFEDKDRKINVLDAYDIGYLFCAPLISDFVIWFYNQIIKNSIKNIWLCARDGYLIQQMMNIYNSEIVSEYFLTSRIAAIRAGIEMEEDIRYVDEMNFSGSVEMNLAQRFGIEADKVNLSQIDNSESGLLRYKKAIMQNAKSEKANYKKYIDGIELQDGEIAFFDFVAKGTSQMYISRLVDKPLKGFYFLQLELEYMKEKNLDIIPFYETEETSFSAIYDNYYILETILTAPHASLKGFDESGNPVYAKETRSDKDIECFKRAQAGICEYFKKYLELCPASEIHENKKLDEVFLTIIRAINILDKDFLSLTVEDPFFNRMTDITDVL